MGEIAVDPVQAQRAWRLVMAAGYTDPKFARSPRTAQQSATVEVGRMLGVLEPPEEPHGPGGRDPNVPADLPRNSRGGFRAPHVRGLRVDDVLRTVVSARRPGIREVRLQWWRPDGTWVAEIVRHDEYPDRVGATLTLLERTLLHPCKWVLVSRDGVVTDRG